MNSILKVVIFIGAILGLFSCEIINPEEKIPSYIKIDKIDFDPKGVSGARGHQISDAWVQVGGDLIGVFELPATIPVLQEGVKEVQVFPGIYLDGIKGQRIDYPMYSSYKQDVELMPAGVVSMNPVVTYNDQVELPFRLYDDFDGASGVIDSTGNSAVPLIRNNTEYLFADGGSYSGLAIIPAGQKGLIEIANKSELALPQDGRQVYCEFNYKTSLQIVTGLRVYQSGGGYIDSEDLVLLPTEKWKKVYVYMTPELNSSLIPKGSKFKIFIKGLSDGEKEQHLAIDNFRIVHKK